MINTILLAAINLIGVLLLIQYNELKTFIKETRKKLDDHVENISMHGLHK